MPFQSKWFPSFLFTFGTQRVIAGHLHLHLPVTSFLLLVFWLVSPLLFPSINICCTKANRMDWTGKYHRASSMSDLSFFYALALMTLILCLWCSFSSFVFAVLKGCCFWECFWLFCCPYIFLITTLSLFPRLPCHYIFFKLFSFLLSSSMHIYVAVTNRSSHYIEIIYQIIPNCSYPINHWDAFM